MDTQVFNEISSACGEILSQNGFKCKTAEGKFVSENQEFYVKFDEDASQFILEYVDKTAGDSAAVLSSWLFNGENKGDIIVIKEDFCDSISKKLGIKSGSKQNIAMPTKSAAGSLHTIDSLTQKFLAIYPQFKEDYKENVANNGSFYYVDFYKNVIVPRIIEQTSDIKKNSKPLEKLFKSLGEIFYNSDRTTSDALCGVIIAGTFVGRGEVFEECVPFLEDYPYFITACREIIKEVNRNKKFKAVFDK